MQGSSFFNVYCQDMRSLFRAMRVEVIWISNTYRYDYTGRCNLGISQRSLSGELIHPNVGVPPHD